MKAIVISLAVLTIGVLALFGGPAREVMMTVREDSQNSHNSSVHAERYRFKTFPDVFRYEICRADGAVIEVFIAHTGNGIVKLHERQSGIWSSDNSQKPE